MIFQHTHEWILQPSPHTGELKTQTRRLVKPGECFHYDEYPIAPAMYKSRSASSRHHLPDPLTHDVVIKSVHCRPHKNEREWNYRTKWQVGKSYAVQPGRGKPAIGRIRITGIRREDVRDISDEDTHAEGFDSREAFWDTWVSMHDKSWHKEFCYAADYGRLRKYGFYDRPAERYDAWVITFTAEPLAQPTAPGGDASSADGQNADQKGAE